MEGRPETAPLLELAARAENLGFDSVWVGIRCWPGRATIR